MSDLAKTPPARRPRRSKPLRPKLPTRRDSQEVVESIVVAASDILAEEGIDGLTTNRIAERAGVGVASVYRYFKDKIAIVAEIDLRNRRANTKRLLDACSGLADNDAKNVAAASAIVRAFLYGFLDTRDGRSRIRKTLMTEVPLSWVALAASESWSQGLRAVSSMVLKLRPDLSTVEVERRVFLALHAVQGIVTGQLVFPPPHEMTQDEAVAYVERLIVPFLLAPVAP